MNQKAVAIGTQASAVPLTSHLQAHCTGRVYRRHQPLQKAEGRWRQAFAALHHFLFYFFIFCIVHFRAHGNPRVVHKTTRRGNLRTFGEPDTLTEHLIFVFGFLRRAAERFSLPSHKIGCDVHTPAVSQPF